MRLVQLVSADVRRFRSLIAGWLLIVAAGAAVAGVRPAIVFAPGVPSPMGTITGLLWFATIVLTIAIVPRIVQADSAVGSSAFWMTRPISGRLLLASKAITLALLLVVVPVLSELLLMSIYRVPAAAALKIAAEAAVYQMLFVIILMTVAALTPDVSGFALACGTVLATVIVVMVVVSYIDSVRRQIGLQPLEANGSDGFSSWLVFLVLAALAGIVAMVLQYGTRRRGPSAAIAIAGLALAWTTATVWPWRVPPLNTRSRVPSWVEDVQSLTLEADPGSVETAPNRFRSPDDNPISLMRARVSLASIAPEWSVNVSLRSATLVVNGRTIPSLDTARFGGASLDVPVSESGELSWYSAVRRLLGVQRLIDFMSGRVEPSVLFAIDDDELRRVGDAPGEYLGRFQIALTRHQIEGIVPLRRGEGFQSGSHRLVVTRIEPTGGRLAVTLRESEAHSMFDRIDRSRWRRYYLRHAGRNEALAGGPGREEDETFVRSFLPFTIEAERETGFRARARTVYFPPAYGSAAGVPNAPIPTVDWLAGTELVIVEMSQEGVVSRALRIPDLRVSKRSS